jgi:hypothetical protein
LTKRRRWGCVDLLDSQPPGHEAAAPNGPPPRTEHAAPENLKNASIEGLNLGRRSRAGYRCYDVGEPLADVQKASDHDDDGFRTGHHIES